MNKLQEILAEQPQEVQFRMQVLALVVKDPQTDPIERLVAAHELGELGGPMIMESLRREAVELSNREPVFEYRFIRGARVKVRVS